MSTGTATLDEQIAVLEQIHSMHRISFPAMTAAGKIDAATADRLLTGTACAIATLRMVQAKTKPPRKPSKPAARKN